MLVRVPAIAASDGWVSKPASRRSDGSSTVIWSSRKLKSARPSAGAANPVTPWLATT